MGNYDVLIVSAYWHARAGEREVLEMLGNIPSDSICEADSLDDALAKIDSVMTDEGRIGVVVTDLKLDRLSGLNVLAHVNSHYPGVPVIIASGDDPSYAANAVLSRGAFAYVQKGDGTMLCSMVRKALESGQGQT